MQIVQKISEVSKRVVETIETDKNERFIGCFFVGMGQHITVGIMDENLENMDLALEWLETGNKLF